MEWEEMYDILHDVVGVSHDVVALCRHLGPFVHSCLQSVGHMRVEIAVGYASEGVEIPVARDGGVVGVVVPQPQRRE